MTFLNMRGYQGTEVTQEDDKYTNGLKEDNRSRSNNKSRKKRTKEATTDIMPTVEEQESTLQEAQEEEDINSNLKGQSD